MIKVLVKNIEWDADEVDAVNLPKKMKLNIDEAELDNPNDDDELSDYISDKISDDTGWCHNGFEFYRI